MKYSFYENILFRDVEYEISEAKNARQNFEKNIIMC